LINGSRLFNGFFHNGLLEGDGTESYLSGRRSRWYGYCIAGREGKGKKNIDIGRRQKAEENRSLDSARRWRAPLGMTGGGGTDRFPGLHPGLFGLDPFGVRKMDSRIGGKDIIHNRDGCATAITPNINLGASIPGQAGIGSRPFDWARDDAKGHGGITGLFFECGDLEVFDFSGQARVGLGGGGEALRKDGDISESGFVDRIEVLLAAGCCGKP
jgi:hypothetical protein